MQQFKFSLQAVLDHREDIEDAAKINYQKALSVYEETLFDYNKMREDFDSIGNRIDNNTFKFITELQFCVDYRERLKLSLIEQLENLNVAKKSVDLAQGKLIDAKKDVEVLKKLKLQKQEEYDKEILYEESKQLDEFFVMSKARDVT